MYMKNAVSGNISETGTMFSWNDSADSVCPAEGNPGEPPFTQEAERFGIREGEIGMHLLIACCGLNCEACDARAATIRNDDALRQKTAELWSRLNGVEITEDMIRCTGCRADGVKTPYCDGLCPIRRCVAEKGYATCAECGLLEECDLVRPIIGTNEEARNNLLNG